MKKYIYNKPAQGINVFWAVVLIADSIAIFAILSILLWLRAIWF